MAKRNILLKIYRISLLKAYRKKSSDFDSDILSSDADLQSIADAAEQLPLMSEKRCVCVNDFDFESLSESDLKSLIAFCSDLPESTVLIFPSLL